MLLFVYLADISRNLSVVLGLSAFFIICFVLGYALFKEKLPSAWGWCVALSVLMMTLSALVPSKQGVYQIMAAYGAVETVQYLQQSDDAKRIAGKSIQAIEKMLDDAIKEDKK